MFLSNDNTEEVFAVCFTDQCLTRLEPTFSLFLPRKLLICAVNSSIARSHLFTAFQMMSKQSFPESSMERWLCLHPCLLRQWRFMLVCFCLIPIKCFHFCLRSVFTFIFQGHVKIALSFLCFKGPCTKRFWMHSWPHYHWILVSLKSIKDMGWDLKCIQKQSLFTRYSNFIKNIVKVHVLECIIPMHTYKVLRSNCLHFLNVNTSFLLLSLLVAIFSPITEQSMLIAFFINFVSNPWCQSVEILILGWSSRDFV